jgi:hypothetical protein
MELHPQMQEGYLLLRGKLSEEKLQVGLSCMQGEKMDYSKMKDFIDQHFIPTIQDHVQEMSSPTYIRFRYSDKTNATDAATFHGDIYNHSKLEIVPIYTALCYFDDAQLEVIPGSHRMNKEWSLVSYQKRKVLHVQRGDILLFHANLHHRGINYQKTEHRRLLQVFDVFPYQQTYQEHTPHLAVVQSSNSTIMKHIVTPLLVELSKFPGIVEVINFVHYFFVNNDLQYKMSLMDLDPWTKEGKYISYEPIRRIDHLGTEDINVIVCCDPSIQVLQTSNYYLYMYLIYWIVSFILLYYFYRWMNGTNQNGTKKGKGRSRRS